MNFGGSGTVIGEMSATDDRRHMFATVQTAEHRLLYRYLNGIIN
jgi:hypothetical protein